MKSPGLVVKLKLNPSKQIQLTVDPIGHSGIEGYEFAESRHSISVED